MNQLEANCKKMKGSDFSIDGVRALVMILSMKEKFVVIENV